MKTARYADLLRGIVISCQAPEESPLRDPYVMATMARAAEQAGAVGIRAEGAEDIAAIAADVTLPIIGIRKKRYPGSDVYITATRSDVDLVADAGARIIALDATGRDRPFGETLEQVMHHAKERGLVIMADLAASDDADRAVAAGADLLGTTLVPAGEEDVRPGGPNLAVLERIAKAHPGMPLVAEGRYATPEDITAALDLGATTVVVGRAVTDTLALAKDLVGAAHQFQETSHVP